MRALVALWLLRCKAFRFEQRITKRWAAWLPFLVPENKIFSGAALILYSNAQYLDALTYGATAILKTGPDKIIEKCVKI